MRWTVFAGFAALVLATLPATASETITYTYDAQGRLVTAQGSGDVNNGVATATTYDAAGNRTNQTVTGAPTTALISIGNASVTEGGALALSG
jgi:YD repeat-containing protein